MVAAITPASTSTSGPCFPLSNSMLAAPPCSFMTNRDARRPFDPDAVGAAGQADRHLAFRWTQGQTELVDATRQLERTEVELRELALQLAHVRR